MEVIVHGTKGGYKILYKTPNATFSNLRDVRPLSGYQYAGLTIGKQLYALLFANNGVAISKYCIVKDVLRSAIGNIAITIFVEKNKKYKGNDLKILLDSLLEYYTSKYVINGQLGGKQEDWSFIEKVLNDFDKNNYTSQSPQSIGNGTEEAAFIYYASNEELYKYFDAPFQSIYFNYKQVFFISNHLKGQNDNPLNVLRHAPSQDLTGKIDLENPKYTVKDFHGNGKNNITIEVWANHNKISNGNSIYEKDNIRIKYSKDFHESIDETGKLTDFKISRYFIKDGSTVKIKNDVVLSEKSKTISVYVRKEKGGIVHNAKIICEYNSSIKNFNGSTISFEGDELGHRWKVYAEKNGVKSNHEFLTPKDANNQIDFRIQIDKSSSSKPQIGNNQNQNSQKDYEVKAGNHGSLKEGQQCYSNSRYGNDVKDRIIPDRGYKFTAFELQGSKLVAQYEKTAPFYTQPQFIGAIAATTFLALVISLAIIFIPKEPTPKESKIDYKAYTEGLELNLDKLKEYKTAKCDNPVNSYNSGKSNSSWWPFGKSEDEIDEKLCEKLDNAITLRNAINWGDIDAILNFEKFSKEQKNDFGNKIIPIIKQAVCDSSQNYFIKNSLKFYKVSKLDLIKVASFIKHITFIDSLNHNILSEMDSTNFNLTYSRISEYKLPIKIRDTTALDLKIRELKLDSLKSAKVKKTDQNKTEAKVIAKEQNGNTKNKTSQPTNSETPENTKKLEEKFWELVSKNSLQKEDFDSLFKDWEKVYGSDVRKFLFKITSDSNNFSYFKSIRVVSRVNAAKNKDLETLKVEFEKVEENSL